MPRRESADVLRPPPATSSTRSRPGSSSNATRPGLYTLGTSLANSSSSLVGVRGNGNAASDPNLASYSSNTSAGGGPVPATEAPHLSTTEAYFGRMTLTAPDNMRRRKAEEKERKKQGRKKRAERGALAAASLMGPPETSTAGPSTATVAAASTEIGASLAEAKRRKKMRPLPTSNSTSNLHTSTLEQSRSRSPTRPSRPHSAQTNHGANQQRSPERRRAQARVRRGSESSATSQPHRPHSASAAAPVYEGTREAGAGGQGGEGAQQAEVSSFTSATQRRRDIYADLDALGLPGADESDLEDQPPAFPSYATRPISPPRLPAEGEEWTEENRRQQEEYEMNRPPDSPPPAFQSEDETASARRRAQEESGEESGDVSLSDGESMQGEIQRERQEWEDDVAAGFSLEERVERDRARRMTREVEQEASPAPPKQSEQNEEGEAERNDEAPSALLNLGQLVMEARARRGTAAAEESVGTIEEAPSESIRPPTVPPAVAERSPPAAEPATTTHRRVASDGTLLPMTLAAKARATARQAGKRAAVGTGPGLRDGDKANAVGKPGLARPTKIRSRPSGESHSRFRDGASAAANRRMELWGPFVAPVLGEVRSKSATAIDQTLCEGETPLAEQEAPTPAARLSPPGLQRQGSSFSNSALTSAHEGDGEASSDSDEKWDKEEAAFKVMQRRLAPASIHADDSSDDNDKDGQAPHPPGWLRSTSIDLAKPGSSVPRAPPPLALGRSRGGPGYSDSSSSSSSESGAARLADDSDDDSLSPLEAEEPLSEGRSSSSLQTAAPMDKGKQPLRPSLKEADRSTSATFPTHHSSSVPAGDFEEDSGSSHDFISDDDEEERTRREERGARPAVGNRLKGLFSTQLDSLPPPQTDHDTSATSRASKDRLLDAALDRGSHARPLALTPKQSAWADQRDAQPGLSRQPSDQSLRDRERAMAYASLESPKRELTEEQKARLEALEQLSTIQQTGSVPSLGVNQDALGALERLLSRRAALSPGSAMAFQASEEAGAKLTRAGAINRHDTTAPFVNPRSSIAPRPLGRLPTITTATRHFPPSRQSTQTSAATGSTDTSDSRPSPSPFSNRPRRSGIGTPSWMAYIPASERRALPEPLEPVKKRLDGLGPMTGVGGTSTSNSNAPPPLPLRPAGNRVSAMVERFEGQAGEANTSPRSPTRDAFPSPAVDEDSREHTLRRRPPPPPPPSSWQRHGTLPKTPPSPPQPDAPSRSGQTGDSMRMPTLPTRPSFLPTDLTMAASDAHLERSTDSPFAAQPAPLQPSPLAPGPRRRPLPTPPTFAPASSSTSATHASENAPGEDRQAIVSTRGTQQHQPSGAREGSPASTGDVDAALANDSPSSDHQEATASNTSNTSNASNARLVRASSLGFTDLDLFASRLADQAPADGTNYEDLHLLAEFLGPAKSSGASADEIEALSVGVVEVLRKRIVGKRENGKDKIKLALNVMGVKVERCAVCLVQFKEGNLACLFPCLHVLHEECAAKLLRQSRLCPTCRLPIS